MTILKLIVNGEEIEVKNIISTNLVVRGIHRKALRITTTGMSYEKISTTFVNNATLIKKVIDDLDGNTTEDYSSYSIAGDIVDRRNGTIDVYMCKKTEYEEHNETVKRLEEENARLLFENLTGEEY